MINGFMSSTEHIGTTDKSSKQWGYDPIFVPFEGDGRTLGQMSNTERLMFSSRGRVFRAMRKIIYAHLRATKVNTNE
jgi:inosine/xanthosine triphosphate pyrophosphatase family protein